MSWFPETKLTWLQTFCMRVLQNGPIPRHVAFIMDGNRRYATKAGLQKLKGHSLGFEKLSEALGWCLELGIKEVTLYTFSIENYKRSEEEVSGLMNLFEEKLKQLLQEKEKLNKYEVCIRIIGDLTLLPVEVQKLVAEVVLHTKQYNKIFLNVCMAYTSRNEITSGVKDIAEGIVGGKLKLCDVTEELLSHSLYSADATAPDLMVRTSGEVRLSDFLLWQSSFSLLAFLKVLWPEFTIWDLFLAVLYYQHHHKAMQVVKKSLPSVSVVENKDVKDRQSKFLSELQKKRLQKLVDMRDGKTEQHVPQF